MSGVVLHNFLDFWATRWIDRVAIRNSGGTGLTWRELSERSDRIAAGLNAMGIGHNDAVGILMSNRIEFIEAILAILKVGGRVTILNLRFTEQELLYPVSDTKMRAVFTESSLIGKLALSTQRYPDLRLISVDSAEEAVEMAKLRDCSDILSTPDISENDIALICYSSGTTGFPKGVMLSHRNIREGALATAIPCCITPNDNVLISSPLAYTWGIVQYLRESLVTGCTVTVVDPSAGVDELIDVIVRDRISMWSAVPIIFEQVAASPRFAKTDFSFLRHVISGASSLHLQKKWREKGVTLGQAYGLSETGGHVSILFGEYALDRMDGAGQALPGVKLRIIDEAGHPVPAGEAGEICIRGPMVMQGYLNNPEETEKAIVDGWLRTGDIGSLDADGFLKVTGRSKDMIRSGGLNIYPAELERVLAGVGGLQDFAIIPVSDRRWGEVPMIVYHGDELDTYDICDYCSRVIANYKRPRYLLRYAGPLPRTFSGKIRKQALREEFSDPPEAAFRLDYT